MVYIMAEVVHQVMNISSTHMTFLEKHPQYSIQWSVNHCVVLLFQPSLKMTLKYPN